MECTLDPTNKRTKMNLSVSTGEDIFSDNHMNIEPTSTTAVSNITLGETALTNMTCDVHSALKMMHIMDTGKSDSHPFQLMITLSIPTINSASVTCNTFLPASPLIDGDLFSMLSFPATASHFHAPSFIDTISLCTECKWLHKYSKNTSRQQCDLIEVTPSFCHLGDEMSSKMSSHLLTPEYNVYEETGIHCTNHHICKWGVIVGIQKDIQVSQHLSLSHPSLNGRLVTVDIILGTSSSKAFVHRFIGAYTPWNPSTDDGDFWTQVAKICNDLQNSSSLTGDLNSAISAVEHPSGGTDARRQYSRFLQETNSFDQWGSKLDCTRERDWTCWARGSSSGGNIIDCVTMS